ncbi:MAG: hypothetical protein PF689_05410 [Deltaproteobacteria bacterium]|jgi:hypothetical protein|nr:hypothetical protein [Deltaproteobacteria bacterium]
MPVKFFKTISLSCIYIFSGYSKSTETSTSQNQTTKKTKKSIRTSVKPAPPKKTKKVVYPPIKWSKLIKMAKNQDIAVLPDKKGIWYLTNQKSSKKYGLYFYDLLNSSSHLILKNYPEKTDPMLYPITIHYKKDRLSGLPSYYMANIQINMDKLSHSFDYGFSVENEYEKKSINKKLADLQLQNKDFLKTLNKRGKDRQLYPPKPKGKFKKLKLIHEENCRWGSKELCGNAVFIPGTDIYTVLIEHSCEDRCHSKTIFYDADKKIFIDPDNLKKTYKTQVDTTSINFD